MPTERKVGGTNAPRGAAALTRASSAERATRATREPLRLSDAACTNWRTLGALVMAESARRPQRRLRSGREARS